MMAIPLPTFGALALYMIPAYLVKQGYDAVVLPSLVSASIFVHKIGEVEPPHHHQQHKSFANFADKHLHYLLFGGLIAMAEYFGVNAILFPKLTPMMASLFTAAVIGAALQGNPKCPAQEQISAVPLCALTIGAFNGALCCAVQNLLVYFFASSIGLGQIGAAAGFVINWGMSSEYMCRIEGAVDRLLGLGDGRAIGDVSREIEGKKKGDCCKN